MTAGKWFALVAPHRPDDGDLIDHAADVREPVGHRNAGLAVTRERPQAGNDGPAHLGQVVAEADGVDQLAGPALSFGSKVSMWLTPPHMNRKMTDLAWAASRAP